MINGRSWVGPHSTREKKQCLSGLAESRPLIDFSFIEMELLSYFPNLTYLAYILFCFKNINIQEEP